MQDAQNAQVDPRTKLLAGGERVVADMVNAGELTWEELAKFFQSEHGLDASTCKCSDLLAIRGNQTRAEAGVPRDPRFAECLRRFPASIKEDMHKFRDGFVFSRTDGLRYHFTGDLAGFINEIIRGRFNDDELALLILNDASRNKYIEFLRKVMSPASRDSVPSEEHEKYFTDVVRTFFWYGVILARRGEFPSKERVAADKLWIDTLTSDTLNGVKMAWEPPAHLGEPGQKRSRQEVKGMEAPVPMTHTKVRQAQPGRPIICFTC